MQRCERTSSPQERRAEAVHGQCPAVPPQRPRKPWQKPSLSLEHSQCHLFKSFYRAIVSLTPAYECKAIARLEGLVLFYLQECFSLCCEPFISFPLTSYTYMQGPAAESQVKERRVILPSSSRRPAHCSVQRVEIRLK